MKQKYTFGMGLLLIPLISFIVWLCRQHTLINYLNNLFIIATICFITLFLLLIIQEGIFDATSFGFRRLKYQLSSKKKRTMIEDDEFFNPQHVKEDYPIFDWLVPLLIISLFILLFQSLYRYYIKAFLLLSHNKKAFYFNFMLRIFKYKYSIMATKSKAITHSMRNF